MDGVVVFQGHRIGTVAGYNRKTHCADRVALHDFAGMEEAGALDTAFAVVTEAEAVTLPIGHIDIDLETSGNVMTMRPRLVQDGKQKK